MNISLPTKLLSIFLVPLIVQSASSQGDWRQWRGPNGNGTTNSQKPPTKWNKDNNIIWKTKVPGRGHSSPTLLKDRIYLTTADEEQKTQSVICFDRINGEKKWEKKLHEERFVRKIHQKNTHASPTIATDGKSLYVFFNNDASVILSKLDLNGELIWQKNAGAFVPFYPFGFASSPTIWKSLVIVSAECEKTGFVCAYDKETGDEVWRTARRKTSFSSPIVAEVGGRTQLLLSGAVPVSEEQKSKGSVSGYDPSNGKLLWTAPAIWMVSCGTLVWDSERVFASGGYPQAQTLCVKADGSGEIVWQSRVKCYEQSMLYHEGYLYGINDSGVGYCWKADDGTVMWRERMGGPVSSSPILADGRIYYSTERGDTYVFKTNPKKFELLAKNKLGDSTFATPAFCHNNIYMRYASNEDEKRQEYLVCIGESK